MNEADQPVDQSEERELSDDELEAVRGGSGARTVPASAPGAGSESSWVSTGHAGVTGNYVTPSSTPTVPRSET